MLTPTAQNVSKFSWFPSMSSWRRNFLGNTLHSWRLKSCWCSQSKAALLRLQPPFVFCCWPTTLLSGMGLGQDCSCGYTPHPQAIIFFLPNSELYSEQACAEDCVEFLTKARKVCSPWLDLWMWERPDTCVGGCWGPCSWRAPTSWSNKRDEETVLWHREDPVKITDWGQCLRTHISLLFFFSTLFPTSPIQAFPELYVPAATQRPLFQTQNSGLDEWEYIIDIWKHDALS